MAEHMGIRLTEEEMAENFGADTRTEEQKISHLELGDAYGNVILIHRDTARALANAILAEMDDQECEDIVTLEELLHDRPEV